MQPQSDTTLDPPVSGALEVPEHGEHRSFLRASAVVGVLTLVSRVTGFAREVAIAGVFGTTPTASALVLAQQVPNLVRSLMSEEGAHGTLVPTLTEFVDETDERGARALAGLYGLVSTAILTLFTVVVLVAAPPIVDLISPGLSSSTSQQTADLLRLYAPVIMVNGALGAASALLASTRRFVAVGLGPIFSNVPVLVGLLALQHPSARLVAVLLMAGYAMQALFLVLACGVRPRVHGALAGRPHGHRPLRPVLRRIMWLSLPIVLSLGMANLSGTVDLAFSSLVNEAAPAALDKALRLTMLPYGVFAMAIGVVALPALSRAVVRGSGFDGELVRAVRLQAVLLVPIAVAFVAFSTLIIRLVYERGAFDVASREITAKALVGLSIALPCMGLSLVGTRAWMSKKRPAIPAMAAGGGLILNGLLDWLLIKPFGVAGIGASTACVHAAVGSALILGAAVDRGAVARELGRFLTRLAVAMGCVVGVGLAVKLGLGSAIASDAVVSALALLAGAGTLALVATRLGLSDYADLVGAVARR